MAGYPTIRAVNAQADTVRKASSSVLGACESIATVSLDPDAPVAFSLEYQMSAESGETAQVPETLTFSFEFYDGLATAHKFSLIDYPVDKVQ